MAQIKTPALTALAVKNAKPRDKRYEIPDGDMPGLFLVVQPTSAKSWALRYVYNKRHYKLTLGSSEVLSLADARKQALKAKSEKATGANPVQTRKEARDHAEATRQERIRAEAETKARQKIDAEDAFEIRYETYRVEHIEMNMKPTTADDVKRIFKRDVLPEFKKLRLGEIRKKHCEKLLARVLKDHGPYSALRLHALLNHFFGYFEKKTYEDEAGSDVPFLPVSPMRTVEAPAKAKKRRRIFSDDEIRWFWKACEEDSARISDPNRPGLKSTFGRMLQLIFLNAARRDEVRCMSRSEFGANSGEWKLPAERSKNGLDFLIPMAPASIEILESLPRVAGKAGFVFTTTGETPVSGLSKCKARIEKAMLRLARDEAKERGEDVDNVTIAPWRIHDLRRTARTNFSRLGIRAEIAERCVNHVLKHSDVEDVYNLYDYRPEKADALKKWADFVLRLVDGTPANVTTLTARRGVA